MAMQDNVAITESPIPTEDETRINHAAEAIRGMTRNMVEDLPLRHWAADTLRTLTVKAPLRSLAVAFLLGVIVARARG